MKLISNTSFLGIAVGERSLAIAEVGEARGRWEVRRAAEYTFVGGGAAAQEGGELRRFLKENEFTASRAVIGLPAKWLVAREKDVPPAKAYSAARRTSQRPRASATSATASERSPTAMPRKLVFDISFIRVSKPRQRPSPERS
jgi:hypothetical protein